MKKIAVGKLNVWGNFSPKTLVWQVLAWSVAAPPPQPPPPKKKKMILAPPLNEKESESPAMKFGKKGGGENVRQGQGGKPR